MPDTSTAPATLRLLDGAALLRDGQPPAELVPSAPMALLACLALQPDWVPRERLMALFWPDAGEADAQHHLRVTLHRARQWLSGHGAAAALLGDRRRLRLALPCDVHGFNAALQRGDWGQAVALHRAPLWASFSMRGFAQLHDWLARERESLLAQWRNAALRLASEREATGDAVGAAELLQAQLQHDLMAEDVVQALMRVAARADQRALALELFERFRRRARDELGLDPLPATLALATRLRDRVDGDASRAAAAPPPVADAGTPLAEVPLVGRQAETALLAQNRRGLLLVQGEPGVGKTRLVAEARRGALWLRCSEDRRDEPLQPLLDTLHGLDLALLRDRLPDAADRRVLARLRPDLAAGERLPPQSTPSGRLAAVLAQLLVSLGADAGLVVDDLQWADTATLQVLHEAIAGGAGVVATLRSAQPADELERWLDDARAAGWLRLLPLQPLPVDGVAELLQRLGITAPDPQFAGRLQAHTGGNVLFVIETLRAWLQRGLRPPAAGDDGSHALEIPERVQALVRQRIAALDDTTQRVLTVAALAGDAEHLDGLAELAGLSAWATAQALGLAQAAGLLHGPRFAHELVRQALLSRTPEPLRRLLHAGIARRLAGVLPAHRVADHAWAGGERGIALDATLRATAIDRERGLHPQAALRLRQAQARVGDGPDAARLLCALVATERQMGQIDSALELAQQALLQLPLPDTRAGLALELYELLLVKGRLDEAEGHLQAAAESGADDLQVTMGRTRLAHARGDLAQAEALMRQQLALLRRRPPGAELACALTSLASTLDGSGRLAEAQPLHDEALALARRMGARYAEVEVCVNLMWSLDERGCLDEAAALGEQALALGEYDVTPYVASLLAYVYLRQDRLDEAARLYQRQAASADTTIACVAQAKLVDIAARRGNAAALRGAADAALRAIDRTEVYTAQAVAITSVLRHGSPAQAEAARSRLRRQPLDPGMQARLDEALRHAGHAPASEGVSDGADHGD